ncbi:MAG: hypothetical protein ACXWOL_14295 [Ktedonobacteraceae bacterium]
MTYNTTTIVEGIIIARIDEYKHDWPIVFMLDETIHTEANN